NAAAQMNHSISSASDYSMLYIYRFGYRLDLLSFPTRRSSDLYSCRYGSLVPRRGMGWRPRRCGRARCGPRSVRLQVHVDAVQLLDRKSTRLNSSHVKISYAVFCLKKKTSLALVIDFSMS